MGRKPPKKQKNLGKKIIQTNNEEDKNKIVKTEVIDKKLKIIF